MSFQCTPAGDTALSISATVGTPASDEHEAEGAATVATPTQVSASCSNVHTFLETLAMEISCARLQLDELNARLNGTPWASRSWKELTRKSEVLERFIFCARELQFLKGPLELQRFPSEIRQMIFNNLLVKKRTITLSSSRLCRSRPDNRLAIFRTSKSIFLETFAMYFSRNTFGIDCNRRGDLPPELKSTQVQRHISHIDIRIGCIHSTIILDFLRAIENCSALKTLYVTMGGHVYSTNFGNVVFRKPASLVKISVEIVNPGWNKKIRAERAELATKLHRVLEGKEWK